MMFSCVRNNITLYNKNSTKPKGFTLIELVVVISTIALLAAILIPTLRKSKQHANAVLCSSNIKQLLFGFSSYENENHTFPHGFDNTSTDLPAGGYPGNLAIDRRGWWWFNFIEESYSRMDDKRTVVRCPSKRISDPILKDNILCGNYGVNRSICKSSDDRQSQREEFVGIPLRSSNILHPGETLLLVDSGYAMISWWHATNKPPVNFGSILIEDTAYIPGLSINKDRKFFRGQSQDAIYGRHLNKTVNVGFVDNHVNRVKAETLFVEKTTDGYKNKSPLWTPFDE